MARAKVLYGRWAGRTGEVIGEHNNPGGRCQQPQTYTIIRLDEEGKAKQRVVRVLAVEPL